MQWNFSQGILHIFCGGILIKEVFLLKEDVAKEVLSRQVFMVSN